MDFRTLFLESDIYQIFVCLEPVFIGIAPWTLWRFFRIGKSLRNGMLLAVIPFALNSILYHLGQTVSNVHGMGLTPNRALSTIGLISLSVSALLIVYYIIRKRDRMMMYGVTIMTVILVMYELTPG